MAGTYSEVHESEELLEHEDHAVKLLLWQLTENTILVLL